MNEYKFEIEYLYQPFKESPARVHWMYFVCKAKTLAAAKTLAEKEYKSRMAGLGWTRFTTLTEIRPPKRANDPVSRKTVSPDTLPAKRSSKSSSSSNTKRKSGTKTGSSRRTSTSKRKPKT